MTDAALPLWAEITIAAMVLTGATIALLGSWGLLRLKATLNKPSKFPARTRKTPFFGFCGLLRRPFGPFAGP